MMFVMLITSQYNVNPALKPQSSLGWQGMASQVVLILRAHA